MLISLWVAMLKFDENTHTYTLNGKIIPSVTQIMSRVGVRECEEAPFKPISGGFVRGGATSQNFGKAVHKAAELILQGQSISVDENIKPWIIGIEKFLNDYGNHIEVIETERLMYSKIYGYAGTVDLVGMFKDVPLILDWKTGTVISETWNYQTAAYEQLNNEFTGNKKLSHRWAVQICENDYHVIKRYNHKTDFNRFMSILNVYKMAA